MPLIQTDSQHYSDIADAIRNKTGGSETYYPADMARAINSILPVQGQSVGIRDVTNFITPHSGITLASDFVYRAIQIGNIVFLMAKGGIASGASANDYILFDIDNAILPIADTFNWGYGGNRSIKYFRAFTDGIHAQDGWYNIEIYWQVAQTYYGNSVHNYSTNEQVIGTWIDGKPLYEKTFYYASLPSSGENIFPVDIVVNKVTKIDGMMLWYEYAFKLPFVSWDNGLTVELAYNTNTNDIRIHPRNSSMYQHISDIYVIVQYTKTTD